MSDTIQEARAQHEAIKCVIPLVPVAQARARHAVRNGRAMAYKSATMRGHEADLIALLREHRPAQPMEGALAVRVRAYLPIPVSMPKRRQANALAGDERPAKKPDLDNLLKHVLDCCTKLNFWRDDSQICDVVTSKRYSDVPRWEIEIEAA